MCLLTVDLNISPPYCDPINELSVECLVSALLLDQLLFSIQLPISVLPLTLYFFYHKSYDSVDCSLLKLHKCCTFLPQIKTPTLYFHCFNYYCCHFWMHEAMQCRRLQGIFCKHYAVVLCNAYMNAKEETSVRVLRMALISPCTSLVTNIVPNVRTGKKFWIDYCLETFQRASTVWISASQLIFSEGPSWLVGWLQVYMFLGI